MRLTVLGAGDAFGSGGRLHTCFAVEAAGRTVLLDCGATALPAMRRYGVDPARIDAVVLSHLHGDHFGGLPFLLLEAQFVSRRSAPLLIAGPPGAAARIDAALDVFFPGARQAPWRFDWRVVEIVPGEATSLLDWDVLTTEVVHGSGAPSTGVRLSAGGCVLAYSGDTEWTEALVPLADGADLFVVECYSPDKAVTGHMSWPDLERQLPRLAARRIMVTHLNAGMIAAAERAMAAGLLVAEEGLVLTVDPKPL
jgi:ribonuclease BN (tRNA processing enzyme)